MAGKDYYRAVLWKSTHGLNTLQVSKEGGGSSVSALNHKKHPCYSDLMPQIHWNVRWTIMYNRAVLMGRNTLNCNMPPSVWHTNWAWLHYLHTSIYVKPLCINICNISQKCIASRNSTSVSLATQSPLCECMLIRVFFVPRQAIGSEVGDGCFFYGTMTPSSLTLQGLQ